MPSAYAGAWAAWLAAVGLAGCVTLSQPAPQVRDFRLDYEPPAAGTTPLDATIRVPPLGVVAVYDRQAIAYRDDTYASGTYLYDRWAANPGRMIADLLARDLAASGQYRAVQQGPSMLPSDYQLNGQVEEIEERVKDGACVASLRLRLLLVRSRATDRDPVVLRAAYAEEEPCACNSATALVGAMSRALQRLSRQVQQDIYAAIAADGTPTSSAPAQL
jgi:ABC-type uncharacterized transport system auxiliary subunit